MFEKGVIDESVIDTAVRRSLYAKFASGLFDDPYGNRYEQNKRHTPESVRLSKAIADESTVLLKNETTCCPSTPNA